MKSLYDWVEILCDDWLLNKYVIFTNESVK
jgi:hypothetical protein